MICDKAKDKDKFKQSKIGSMFDIQHSTFKF